MPGAHPARPPARARRVPGAPPRCPSSWGSDPPIRQRRPPPPTPHRQTPHAPARLPPEPLHLLGSRTQRCKNHAVRSPSHGHPCRSAPDRARPPPIPHASLFPGGRRRERPGRLAGPWGRQAPHRLHTHQRLRTGAGSTAEAPWRRPGRARRLQRGRGRGCGRGCGSPGASRAPDCLPAAAPLHLRATPPSLRR